MFEWRRLRAAQLAVVQRLRLARLVEHVGSVETLITHPATMTHADVPAKQRAASGISDGLLRLSVGIEPAFGTLGRPGQRLDDQWIADGDVSEFEALIDGGLVMLATDIPYDLLPLLEADDTAAQACPR